MGKCCSRPRHRQAALSGLLLGVFLAATACSNRASIPDPAPARTNDPVPADAATAILAAFDKYPLVALAEAHGLKEQAEFISQLIQDPDFPKKADTIVIEAGNARYQPLIDRYVGGENVSLDELRSVWRDHTCSALGPMDSPNLELLFKTVRTVNQKLPPAQRLRVLAGDPPIDWRRIQTNADFRPWLEQRDNHYAHVVETAVLEKSRQALLVTGGAHLSRKPSAGGGEVMLQRLERNYPGKTFVVQVHIGFGDRNGELEPRLASWPTPSLTHLRDTWLGELDAALHGIQDVMLPIGEVSRVAPGPREMLQDNADAYLYLGPSETLTMEQRIPDLLRDNSYVQELHRRHRIVHGRGLDLAELLKRRPKKYVDNFKEPNVFQTPFRQSAASPGVPVRESARRPATRLSRS